MKKDRGIVKKKNDSEAQTHRSYLDDFKNVEVQTKTWEEIIKEYQEQIEEIQNISMEKTGRIEILEKQTVKFSTLQNEFDKFQSDKEKIQSELSSKEITIKALNSKINELES